MSTKRIHQPRKEVVVVRNLSGVSGLRVGFHRGHDVIIEGRSPLRALTPSESEGLKSSSSVTEIDAKGGVLLPGYHNCHYHTIYALLGYFDPIYSIFRKTTKQEVLEALKTDVPSRKEMGKGLILAYGLNTVKVQDLTREDLDAIESQIPMIVFDPSYHGAVVNTAALKLIQEKSGIRTKETGLPVAGELRANGQLTEDYVFIGFTLMDDKFGSDVHSAAQKEAEVIYAWMKEQVKIGITLMHDMAVFTPVHALAIMLASEKGEREMGIAFPIEKMYFKPEALQAIFRNPEYSDIATRVRSQIGRGAIGIKLLADGSFGSYTALLTGRYLDIPTMGSEVDSIHKCYDAILLASRNGISDVRMHAIGNAGIMHALIVLAAAREELGNRASLGIEHFELSNYPGILSQTRDLGIVVCSQPNFGEDIQNYKDRLGTRVRDINPHRSILNMGIPLITGDDGMPASALGTIHDFTHHPVAEQRLSLREAIAIASRTEVYGPAPSSVDGLMVVTPEAFSKLDSTGKPEEQIRAEMSNIWEASTELNKAVTHIIISGKVM